jgi:hypothetical protein
MEAEAAVETVATVTTNNENSFENDEMAESGMESGR